jgi:hypothetical protein
MSTEKDAAEAAEFADLLAELEANQGPEAEDATPEAIDVDSDPEADEESEDESEEEDLETAEAIEPAADVAEIAELIQAGDLKAACAKMGIDPGIFKINNRQFAAIRKGQAEAKRLKAEADEALRTGTHTKAQGEQLQRQAEEVYGPIVAGAKAYKSGDPMRARAALELMFEDKFENIVATMARAARGLDPAQVEVFKLRKELADEKARKAQEQAQHEAVAAQTTQVAQIGQKLSGTPLEGVEGAAEDIFKVLQASVHPTLGHRTKTLKEAFLEVKAVYAKRAASLSRLAPGARPAAPRDPRKPLDKTPLSAKRPVPKKLTADEEFKIELEAAKRETAAQERKIMRRK